MADNGTPHLYTLFGKLIEDADDTILLADVSHVEAIRAFRERCNYMRQAGFHVTERKDDCDSRPYCSVRNPLTGLDEAQYWVRETA